MIGSAPPFGDVLLELRQRAKRSRNSLAHEVGVDASYLTRIEHGDREAPRRYIVVALGRVLRLSTLDCNRLLVAAGYVPAALGEWDETLQSVVDVLSSPHLSQEERSEFGAVVCAIAARWRPTLNALGDELGRGSVGVAS